MINPLNKLGRDGRLLWVSLGGAYFGVHLGRQMEILTGFLNGHLTDLFCMPLVLGIILMAQRMAGRPLSWTMPSWHGLMGSSLFSIYFELILPHMKTRVVGDPLDAVAYFLGWVLFEFIINLPADHLWKKDPNVTLGRAWKVNPKTNQ